MFLPQTINPNSSANYGQPHLKNIRTLQNVIIQLMQYRSMTNHSYLFRANWVSFPFCLNLYKDLLVHEIYP